MTETNTTTAISTAPKHSGRPKFADPGMRKSAIISVCLTSFVKDRIKNIAYAKGMPTATLIREILEDYVDKE
jgi:predicted DNA binding CopG/RHH family protein